MQCMGSALACGFRWWQRLVYKTHRGKCGRGQHNAPGTATYLTRALVHSLDNEGAVFDTGTGVAGMVEPPSARELGVLRGPEVGEEPNAMHSHSSC